ncbi:FadR family transcriptional regulator [Novosphingobium flavum]|uniref:FadR/GntR family transcriptional regulator n=1 Tax=Novosphingobium aerophilum TaxID=2839843 RepID=UPI00163A5C59|nr:FadR/GntR family transcriptional regulator [Novosphingobium aerophilum]MBC2661213.1 FadR family transcriptional regulator [Novosphingobium aerophilum]
MAEDDRPAPGRNLTHRLLETIGRQIVTGHYAERPFPTEAELATGHRVSRSVTREAVKMLTAKGLLSARPRLGTTVQPEARWNLFDPDVLRWLLERPASVSLLRQFHQLRRAIEPTAAGLAAQTADAAGLAGIADGLVRMQQAEQGHDDPLEADIAFHVAVLRASNNPFFAQFRDVVGTALRFSIQVTNRIKGGTADVAAHGAVLAAIRDRDADRAERAMLAIIDDVSDLIEGSAGGGPRA